MLACRCPRCGAPTPIRLAIPDRVSCRYCGYAGPMPAGARVELARAASALAACDVRDRQLSGAQARALARGALAEKLFLVGIGLFGLPVFGLAALELVFLVAGHARAGDGWVVNAMGCIGTALPLAIVTSLAFVRVRAGRARLLRSSAAVPPSAPGEPASCRVCGADIVQADRAAVVRCAHCAADNLVSADALARAARERAPVLDRYEEAVAHEARSLGASAGFAVAGWYAALGASFVLCGLPAVIVTTIVSTAVSVARDAGPPPPIFGVRRGEYAMVTTRAGRCVAKLLRGADGAPSGVDFGELPLQGDPGPYLRFEPLDVSMLQGRRIRVRQPTLTSGEVTTVFGTSTGDVARIRQERGELVNVPVERICLEE